MRLLILLAAALSTSSSVFACSCAGIPSLEEALASAQRVAVVRVVSAKIERRREQADVLSEKARSKDTVEFERIRNCAIA